MSIANRILLGFVATTLLMIVLGLLGVRQIAAVRDATQAIVERDLVAYRQLDSVQQAQNDMAALRTDVVMRDVLGASGGGARPSPEQLDRLVQLWAARAQATRVALATAQASVLQFRDQSALPARREAWAQLGVVLDQAGPLLEKQVRESRTQFEAIGRGDAVSAANGAAELSDDRQQFNALMQRCMGLLNDAVALGQAQISRVYDLSRLFVAGALALAVLFAVGLTLLIRRAIVTRMTALGTFAEAVGRGELTHRVPESLDELGRLGRTLNAMVDGLRVLTLQSREATENLNAATAEIRASTQQQAASVEEQLAAVQETAATVDEITHSGSQISRRAQDVIASAQATAQTTQAGLRAVDDSGRAMTAIREQAAALAGNILGLSEKTQTIGEIIATVNDVSERSHLLALNAAIEAAAAGEYGRSFSVVASEMKALADQAKEATVQVRAILGDIQRGINASVMLTEEAVKRADTGQASTDVAQRTIETMTASIQESVQTFQQIVASTNQQQIGIEQVMVALQNIRQASQQTAAGTRQLDTAAADLAGLSRQLMALADRYRA